MTEINSIGPSRELPIGIFDSGMGGLTVLRTLRARLPRESFRYLGDTARLPYGTKGADTITRYALQAAGLLVARDIKLVVVACNTASAVAMPALAHAFAPLPVIGVVETAAAAAVGASRSGHIAVLATESTVRGGAYERAICARRADARVFSQACSLFVALAEEGWTRGPLVEAIVREYLQPVLGERKRDGLDCVVLGCTHFPLLGETIAGVAGTGIHVIDPSEPVAEAVQAVLNARDLYCGAKFAGSTQFFATDDVERFARVGGRFLGTAIAAADVERVDL
ncbi:MAG: glutamate racemase [Gammaproteobacteria bacterium]